MAKYMNYYYPDYALSIREMFDTDMGSFQTDFYKKKKGNIEFIYVYSGKCEFHIGRDVVELKKKNLLLINANVLHKFTFDKNEPCFILEFLCGNFPAGSGQLTLGELCESNSKLNTFIENFEDYYIVPDASGLYEPIKQLWHEYRNSKNESYINLTLSKLLLDIAREFPRDAQSAQDYVKEAKKYMYHHYRMIENIESISNHVGINKSYLQRLFKEKNGISLWEYLSDIRRNVAVQLLLESDMSIESIYESVGIKSRQTFYAMFYKEYHMSPGEYRKIHKCKK